MQTTCFVALFLVLAHHSVQGQRWWDDDPFDDFQENAFAMSNFGRFNRRPVASRSMFNPWLGRRDDLFDDDDDDDDGFFSRGMFGLTQRRRTPLRTPFLQRRQNVFNTGRTNLFNNFNTGRFNNFNRQNSFNTQSNFNRQNSFNTQSNFNRQNNFNTQSNFNRQNSFNTPRNFNRHNGFNTQPNFNRQNTFNNFNQQTRWQQPSLSNFFGKTITNSLLNRVWLRNQMDMEDFGFDW